MLGMFINVFADPVTVLGVAVVRAALRAVFRVEKVPGKRWRYRVVKKRSTPEAKDVISGIVDNVLDRKG